MLVLLRLGLWAAAILVITDFFPLTRLLISRLLEACQGLPDILETPPPQVFFKGFGESSQDFLLLVWINQPRRQ